MKKKITFNLLICITAFAFFATSAFAWELTLDHFKVTPSTVKLGNSTTFDGKITYDSTIYGVPIPVDGKFQMEVPYALYELPSYDSGSFSSFVFGVSSNTQTGATAWLASDTFFVFGKTSKEATVKAKSNKKGSGKAYVGTGGGHVSDVHKHVSVKVN